MDLLLHIGTHKTATTSIQHFLALNRNTLLKHGFFYPKNLDSAYTFNNLASQIVHNKEKKTKTFIDNAYKTAKNKDAHTIIISAESFYAMTGFFRVLNEPEMDQTAYIAAEEKSIETLKSYCGMFENIKILCCLRSQEDFATSLYNQLVKSNKGITDNYMSFLEHTSLLYDYANHMDLWSKHFGQNNTILFHFNDIKADPIKYFCEKFVTPEIYSATNKPLHSNERLSRDVLEFKLKENEKPYDAAKAFACIQCYHTLAKEFPDKDKWQIYAPLKERQAFFGQYDKGNKYLCQKHGLPELKALSSLDDSEYPGLSAEKRQAIEHRLNQLLSSPANQLSIALRRFVHFFIRRSTFIDRALDPVRAIRNSIRLQFEGW